MTAVNIKSLTREELRAELIERGLKQFRADQILAWIYTRYALSFQEMMNIAKADRAQLTSAFFISSPMVVRTEMSSDGTRKLDRKSTRLNSSHHSISYAV